MAKPFKNAQVVKSIGTMLRRAAPNTGSPESLEMIKVWFKHCEDDHPDCEISVQTSARLPTRLLQIEKSGESFNIRLCLSSALSLSTSYATLSHVWGSGSPMTLVNENLLHCQQDIPIASLPQTFADAIQLTNALGLDYLWVDSLCIIQDSALDWEVESTTMCDVYRGSTINIAASASVDCDGGLFRQRNPLSVTPCIIDPDYEQNRAGAQGEGLFALYCDFASFPSIRNPLLDEPLSRRAWALQERILAPRTVYFTARKIYFGCYQKMTADVDPRGFYGYGGGKDIANNWAIDRPALATSASDLYVCSKDWQRMVQQYTHGQLSYESDKLVAIAGLAEHMQRKWLGPTITYLGGLWSFDLLEGLLWRRSKTLTSLARPKAYRAPSWSWASVEGEVEWKPDHLWADLMFGAPFVEAPYGPTSNQLYGASIIEARTSPTSSPFGSVHGGYIQICGHLCNWRNAAMVEPFWDFDDLAHILADPDGLMLFILRLEGFGLGSMIFTDSAGNGSEGLVLEYTGDKKGQYKRVGVFDDLDGYVLHASQGFRPAEHLFMDVDENGRYTIEIV